MDVPNPVPDDDVVQTYLIGLNLLEHEAEYRGILRHTAEEPEAAQTRDLVASAIGLLMSLAGVRWTVVLCALDAFKKLPDAKLADAAIAIVNGQFLVTPNAEGSMDYIEVNRLTPVDSIPRGLVTVIYSCKAAWEKADEILGT